MPHKRSRPETEQRFIDAVISLLGESGCAHLGINLVAQRTGTDKVLIYRYFGDLDGLLERVAKSRTWLPTAEELLRPLTAGPDRLISKLTQDLIHHVKSDAATLQLARWRHAVKNPLTDGYSNEWKVLWQEIPGILSEGLDYTERQKWAQACSLLAAVTEARLMDQPIDHAALQTLSKELISADLNQWQTDLEAERLPTNLL